VPPNRDKTEFHGHKLMGSAEMADLRRNAGTGYRLGRAMLAVAIIWACVAGAFIAVILTHSAHGDWLWMGVVVAAALTVVFILIGNYLRIQAIHRYRAQLA
jgi:hypothetical protein